MSNNFDTNVILDSQGNVIGFGRAQGASQRVHYDTEAAGGFTAAMIGLTVIGSLSGSTATLVSFKDNGGAGTGDIYVKDVVGAFVNNDVLSVAGVAYATADGAQAAYDQATPTHMWISYSETDPNGSVWAPQGSLCMIGPTAVLVRNTDGGTTWAAV